MEPAARDSAIDEISGENNAKCLLNSTRARHQRHRLAMAQPARRKEEEEEDQDEQDNENHDDEDLGCAFTPPPPPPGLAQPFHSPPNVRDVSRCNGLRFRSDKTGLNG
jgi:hypothetical protein